MHRYVIHIHGSGFAMPIPPIGSLVVGFHTVRIIEAESSEEAVQIALKTIESEESIIQMISETEEAHAKEGLWRIEVLKSERESFFRRFLPARKFGIIYYQNEDS